MAMSQEKQQQRTEERRTQIIDAAMALFDDQGYSSTKIADITEKAGMSKGLVYHYFRSKEEILLAILDRVTDCIEECAKIEDATEALTLFTKRLLSYPTYENYVPPMRIFFTAMIRGEIRLDDALNPIREDFGRSYFAPIFARGQRQGQFRDGDPARFGDYFWKYLIGCMASMNIHKPAAYVEPDMEEMLAVFR